MYIPPPQRVILIGDVYIPLRTPQWEVYAPQWGVLSGGVYIPPTKNSTWESVDSTMGKCSMACTYTSPQWEVFSSMCWLQYPGLHSNRTSGKPGRHEGQLRASCLCGLTRDPVHRCTSCTDKAARATTSATTQLMAGRAHNTYNVCYKPLRMMMYNFTFSNQITRSSFLITISIFKSNLAGSQIKASASRTLSIEVQGVSSFLHL